MAEIDLADETPLNAADNVAPPASLLEFNGQSGLKENLSEFIQSAKIRTAALDHILFHGPPGLGKTTLSQIISSELGVNMRQLSAPNIQKPSDIVTILAGLEERDVLFIDEVHRLSMPIAEMLYVVMQEFRLDIIVGEQEEGRVVSIPLPRFTLIGATTHRGKLPTPFNDRFLIQFGLELYTDEEMTLVIERAVPLLGLNFTPDAIRQVAKSSRGTPRIALGYLNRIRDFAVVRKLTQIDREFAETALKRLGVDSQGLTSVDLRYLKILKDSLRPVGLKTLGSTLSVAEETLETNIEPFLLRKGFITITDRGRTMSKELRNPFSQMRLEL